MNQTSSVRAPLRSRSLPFQTRAMPCSQRVTTLSVISACLFFASSVRWMRTIDPEEVLGPHELVVPGPREPAHDALLVVRLPVRALARLRSRRRLGEDRPQVVGLLDGEAGGDHLAQPGHRLEPVEGEQQRAGARPVALVDREAELAQGGGIAAV